MGMGYIRPSDRVSKLWCRGCASFQSPTWVNAYRETRYAPTNLRDGVRTFTCGNCAGHDTWVWVWGEHLPNPLNPTLPAPAPAPAVVPAPVMLPTAETTSAVAVAKVVPHCGNPSCDGMCNDPLCIPKEEKPVQEINLTKIYVRASLVVGAVILLLRGLYYWLIG
jgi:hypothetical protein